LDSQTAATKTAAATKATAAAETTTETSSVETTASPCRLTKRNKSGAD
jgi:hypothetical protein